MSAAQLYLKWNPVPQSLPPGAETHWFSPQVWLALSDGSVHPGQCLHASKGSEYDGPHDWFIDTKEGSVSIGCNGAKVVAWMPFAVPDHPSTIGYEPMKLTAAMEVAA